MDCLHDSVIIGHVMILENNGMNKIVINLMPVSSLNSSILPKVSRDKLCNEQQIKTGNSGITSPILYRHEKGR